VGKYLDIFNSVAVKEPDCDISDISDKTRTSACTESEGHNRQDTFGRFGRFGRTLGALEGRCPEQVNPDDWQTAVADAQTFIARWGKQAEKLGWTVKDLFGLSPIPPKPHPTFRRLSRYDATGLIWLLHGRPVVALTVESAAIESRTGAVTLYRKNNKPGYGPVGDSLDDLGA
jgi:hypothetical protein